MEHDLEGLQAAQAVNATEARADQIAKLKVDIARRKAKYGCSLLMSHPQSVWLLSRERTMQPDD